MTGAGVDCVYVAACARDARLARICIASIRYFHPDAPIQILAGGRLGRGFAAELEQHWNVRIADLPRGDYGWGFVKLEPLFGPPGERFLVLDADTVFTGKVLDLGASSQSPFVVDDERLCDADYRRLYYDWEKLAAIDPKAPPARKAFNVGQWFGAAGVLRREDFDPWIEWTLPRRLRHPDRFMGGDQGVLNCVVLRKEACEGLRVERRTLMRWPGHGLAGLDLASVAAGAAAPLVIHWAGMKATLLRDMAGGDLLQFFEDIYYSRVPFGRLRRRMALLRHAWIQCAFRAGLRLRLSRPGRPKAAPLAKQALPS